MSAPTTPTPETLAQARRYYLHVLHGGMLTADNVSYMVKAMEQAAARAISDAETIARLRDRLQAIIDWSDLAQSKPNEFTAAEARMLRGPIFDKARAALTEDRT